MIQKLLLTSLFVIISSRIFAQTIVVTDPGAYTYFNGLDKKLQEQLEFSQAIQDANLSINSALSGNKKSAYGINSGMISYDDYFQIRSSALIEAKLNQPAEKPDQISRQLDITFPYLRVSVSSDQKDSVEAAKKSFRAASKKSSLVFADMILNTSKTRVSQIRTLANDIDSTSTTKEAMDLNNRLLLEIITEIRNTNILLANYIKSEVSESYDGSVTTTYSGNSNISKDVSDLLKGTSELGSSMMRPSKGGKFSNMGVR